jgi:hypothetical protein
MAPLDNARALQDPLGIVTQRRQIIVMNAVFRHAAADTDDLDAH